MKSRIQINSTLVQKWLRLLNIPWIVLIIGILIAIIGGVLEAYYCNSLFERFGSLMVMFVIIVIYVNSRFKGEILEQTKDTESLNFLTKHPERMDLFTSLASKDPVIQQKIENELRKLQKDREVNTSNLESSSIKLSFGELIVGISGTFIWGFGELIVKFVGLLL